MSNRASPVAEPAVTATSTALVPNSSGTRAEKLPVPEAVTVLTFVAGADAPGAVPVTATSTVAPGVVVPVTRLLAAFTEAAGRSMLAGTFPPLTATGAVIDSGATAGGLGRYRAATMLGWSTRCPAPESRISRSNCAWAQVSGEAEPSACPSVNPMDAVAGSEPEGEAATAAQAHTCSGTSRTPDARL